ncbi:MAG: 3-phosphoshikimate 1-carboxyvinyltransferase, partial [Planctomycetes bacterium]|nr:3-phosphoshikimate 1-carboxyvinyltransferase [Planctomycetota bacterium]
MSSGPILIPRLPASIHRTWPIPGSKSITNRALVLAALADGETVLDNVLASDDTGHMRRCLEAIGIQTRDTGPGEVTVI